MAENGIPDVVELDRCPFCKSTEVSMSFSAKLDNPNPATRFVECEDCGASGPTCAIDDHGSDDAAKIAAAKCWNIRSLAIEEGEA